ncbi:MAG TPA: deaminase [bacterium]|nr:deaminase [bacterium]HPJ73033.1 deaminase [bacterium]HPQ66458.1 deaminase [bacterium]
METVRRALLRAEARSTCRNIRLAAVIETPSGRLVEGWNGPPERCGPHPACRLGGPITPANLRLCPGVHAEVRALCRAAARGVAVEGGTLYLSRWFPCAPCARALIEAGIVRLVVTEKLSLAKDDCYNFVLAEELLGAAGVETVIDPGLLEFGQEEGVVRGPLSQPGFQVDP